MYMLKSGSGTHACDGEVSEMVNLKKGSGSNKWQVSFRVQTSYIEQECLCRYLSMKEQANASE